MGRSAGTACTRSTRITSAPMSASIIAANGPGPSPAISTIFKPASGPAKSAPPAARLIATCRNGEAGGDPLVE